MEKIWIILMSLFATLFGLNMVEAAKEGMAFPVNSLLCAVGILISLLGYTRSEFKKQK